MTEMIRSNTGIFLTQRIHRREPEAVIHPRAIVVGIQTVHLVELLAVELVWLVVGRLDSRIVEVGGTEGIVVRHLLDIAAGIHHLAVVTEVILVVEVEGEVVGGGIHNHFCVKKLLSLFEFKDIHK